jgi:hypothetical protein
MPDTESTEPMVKTAVTFTPKQFRGLRERAERTDRSVSYLVRLAVDRLLGLDTATIDPRANEQERVA